MALTQPKLEATEARLAALPAPAKGGCLAEARADALGRVRAMGLPGGRDEYWRYTRPDTLNQPDPVRAEPFAEDEASIFDKVDAVTLVFVDGVFDAAASDIPELAGVTIERLADIAANDIHWAKGLYGKLETRGQTPVDRPFAALNTAFASDGVVIHVGARADRPVSLVYRQTDAGSDVFLRHLVKLDEGADLTLIESGVAGARFNSVMEVEIADGAAFHHVRAQGRARQRRSVTHLFARLGRESVFKSFTLAVNGVMTRNECVIELTGDDAVAHVAGACVGDGDFHNDDTVFITHDAERCESRQVFKKVLRNGATGVFQGKILVKPGAQKTDGYQISQSLLLDGDSQFLAKPELEIYADDVVCSHGSTSGAIDEEALFYLRSRGVPVAEATDLLTLAFLAEAIAEIEDEALADEMRTRLEGWLARRKR